MVYQLQTVTIFFESFLCKYVHQQIKIQFVIQVTTCSLQIWLSRYCILQFQLFSYLNMDSHQVIISNTSGTKKYKRLNLLGTGGFAKCFEVVKLQTNARFACKIIPKRNISQIKQRYKLMLEIKIHKYLENEHIVSFEDVFEDSENIYIVMEYCRFQTLKDLVKRRKRLTEMEIKFYTLQIVQAITFIHDKDIIHRDLKLGNILIGDGMQLKICDFGLSTRLKEEQQRKKTVCGTPNYIAPEILDSFGHGKEVDIWSLGVIIFTMLTGKPPYQDDSVESTYFNIRNNQYSFPNIQLSDQIRDLIQKILVLQPSKRLSLDEILAHPFLHPVQDILKTLPAYTLAVPPLTSNNLHAPHIKITSMQIDCQQKQTILDKSIIIKDSSHNYDSQYLQELQFSLRKKSNVSYQIEGHLLYIVYCALSGDSLGFLLSNGQMGCFFMTDQTCIILEYDDRYFNYYQGVNSDKVEIHQYNIGILEAKISKKFQKMSYFSQLIKMIYPNYELQKMRRFYKSKQESIFYVKKVAPIGNNILIKLSNGVIQLNFPDQTVVLSKNVNENQVLYFKRYTKCFKYTTDASSILNLEVRKKVTIFVKIINQLKSRQKCK